MQSKKLACILTFLFISSFLSVSLLLVIQPSTQVIPGPTNSLTSTFTQPHSKLSSEAQTIDSFDVNPAYRWNQTSQGNLNSTIDNSNLVLSNYANSTQANYTANRQLTKTDSNIQWRSSSSVSDNTSDYFRDQLGTSMTFDSSTQGWVNYGSSTISQSNGNLKIANSGTFAGVYYQSPNYINNQVYSNISFNLYCSSVSTIYIYFLYYSSSLSSYLGTYRTMLTCPTTSTLESLKFSSFTGLTTFENHSFNQLRFVSSLANTFYLDNIQLLGSYNYPTLNAYPNNWGFDQSKEYSYDTLGQQTNFTGSTDGVNGNAWGQNATQGYSLTSMEGQYTSSQNFTTALSKPLLYQSQTGTVSFGITYSCAGCSSAPYDYHNIYLSVSTDGGATWITLPENIAIDYTNTANQTQYLTDSTNRYSSWQMPIEYTICFAYSSIAGGTVYISNPAITQANYYDFEPTTVQNAQSQYLSLNTTQASYGASFSKSSLSITASVYKYLSVEFYTNRSISQIYVLNNASQIVCSSSTGWSAGWNLYSCTGNGNWTATESSYYIFFNTSSFAGLSIMLNMIYWYDSMLGNTENWNAYGTNAYSYIDPQGYLIIHKTSTGFQFLNSFDTSASIDTSIYKYLTIRIKASSSDSITLGKAIDPYVTFTATTSFQTFTFDLSQTSSYWTGIITNNTLIWTDSSSINIIITIDSILLTSGPQEQQPFQIGLVNPTTFVPTLNVTQVFFNATTFRWQVELYDSYGTIAAYAYSTNQTYSVNTFYRGKITFTIETSSLEVKLTTDSGSNLFDALYPDSFTINNPQNTFFGLGSGTFQDIYFASYGSLASYSQTYLDYINAPFAEHNWAAANFPIPSEIGDPSYNLINHPSSYSTISPTTSNFLYPSYGYEYYYLDAPQLDSATGTLNQINSNGTFTSAGGLYLPDSGLSVFCIYNVQPYNGSLLNVFCAIITHAYSFINFELFNYSNSLTNKYIQYGSSSYYSNTIKNYRLTATNMWDSALDFNVQTLNQRSILQIQTKSTFNSNDTSSNVYNFGFSLNLTQLNLPYSNEYVMVYGNSIIFNNPSSSGQLTYSLLNWGFTTRDIFSGLIGVIVSPITNNPITAFSNAVANAITGILIVGFRYLVIAFAAIIAPVVTELTAIYAVLGTMSVNLGIIAVAFTGWLRTDLDYLSALTNLSAMKSDLDTIAGWTVAINHITDIYNILNGTAFSNAIDNITNMYNILNGTAFSNAIDNITNLYNIFSLLDATIVLNAFNDIINLYGLFNGTTFIDALWGALFGAAVWASYIDPLISHILAYLITTAVLSALETLLLDLINWFVQAIIIDVVIQGIINAFSYGFNLLLAILPWNWGAFIQGFAHLNLTAIMTHTTNFINWVLGLGQVGLVLFFYGVTFYIFMLPFVANKFDLGPSLQGVIKNAFTLHGTDENVGFGNATIPVKVNALLVWIILATVITVAGVSVISIFLPTVPW